MQPEMSIDSAGNKKWMLRRKYHREDGPAVILANGSKQWMINNKTHRTDGPAIEWADGNKMWFIHGTPLSLDEWLDQNQTLTDEEKIMMKLQYG
jgi:hypothetical protein